MYTGSEENTLIFHIVYIVCVILCAIYHLVFRVVTARHIYQGLNRSSTGAAARLDSVYPLLVGLVKSILLGSIIFMYCIGLCSFVPNWNIEIRSYYISNSVAIYGTILAFTVILVIARIVYIVKRTLRLFVLDHGGTGIGGSSSESSAWRRIFACNALLKVMQTEQVPFEVFIILFALIVGTFDM